MSHEVSLHVDLINTTLEDFATLFTLRIVGELLETLPDDSQVKWQVSEIDNNEANGPAGVGYKKTLWSLSSADQLITLLLVTQGGVTYRRWLITYAARVIADMQAGRSVKMGFEILATHYRRDRLNVVVWEDKDIEPIAGDTTLDWLTGYWGTDDVKLLPLGDAPPLPPRDTARGNPVDPEIVRQYHKLALTTTVSANAIQDTLSTTTDSYYQYCQKYTGETPIDMAERAQKIKQKKWPPAE